MMMRCDACGMTYDLDRVSLRCIYCGALRVCPVERPDFLSTFDSRWKSGCPQAANDVRLR